MKHGTENKLKFKKLQRRLDLALWQAKGLLQTLWDFAKSNAPRGDVGKFTDEELAIGIDWRGEPEELIKALVDNRWLDPSDGPERLVIHDWWEHCEDSIHMQLARHRQLFADGQRPKLTRIERGEREQIIADYDTRCGNGAPSDSESSHSERMETHGERTTGTGTIPEPGLTKPCHTKPNQALPKPGHTGTGPAACSARTADEPVAGVFADVVLGTLKDPKQTDAWWQMASSQRPRPVVSASPADRLNVHGAAVRALEAKDGNRVAIFNGIIADALWKNITQGQERKAQERIKELDRAARGDPAVAR